MKFDKRLEPRRFLKSLSFKGRKPEPVLIGLAALVVLSGLVWLGFYLFSGPKAPPPQAVKEPEAGLAAPLSRDELAFLIHPASLIQDPAGRFKMVAGAGRELEFFTTLQPGLQSFVEGRLATAQAPIAAAVILEPETGRILALAWHNETQDDFNPALTARFPAASVFKVVTAAAALERAGLKPTTKIPYNGRAHTIYRGQLKNKKTKWTRTPTLKEAFAKSVNPVFGKLAIGPVGPDKLSAEARSLGFNATLPFELPLEDSRAKIPEGDDDYQLALIGSGFNRTTTLNPIHGALLAGAVLTKGRMARPMVIDRVILNKGGRALQVVYRGRGGLGPAVMEPATAADLNKLMRATVLKGTARRSFYRARRDKVLRNLEIGGKTGSINDDSQTYRVDWFIGFAKGKKGGPLAGKKLALAVLVAHNLELRGIKATDLSRQMFRFYFNEQLRTAKKRPRVKSSRSSSGR